VDGVEGVEGGVQDGKDQGDGEDGDEGHIASLYQAMLRAGATRGDFTALVDSVLEVKEAKEAKEAKKEERNEGNEEEEKKEAKKEEKKEGKGAAEEEEGGNSTAGRRDACDDGHGNGSDDDNDGDDDDDDEGVERADISMDPYAAARLLGLLRRNDNEASRTHGALSNGFTVDRRWLARRVESYVRLCRSEGEYMHAPGCGPTLPHLRILHNLHDVVAPSSPSKLSKLSTGAGTFRFKRLNSKLEIEIFQIFDGPISIFPNVSLFVRCAIHTRGSRSNLKCIVFKHFVHPPLYTRTFKTFEPDNTDTLLI
jgi:hypothetical protein